MFTKYTWIGMEDPDCCIEDFDWALVDKSCYLPPLSLVISNLQSCTFNLQTMKHLWLSTLYLLFCQIYVIFLGHMPEGAQWLVLTLGEQHQKTSHLSSQWQESSSFLINSLQTDKLVLKLKSKQLVHSITVAQFELQLSDYNLDSLHV